MFVLSSEGKDGKGDLQVVKTPGLERRISPRRTTRKRFGWSREQWECVGYAGTEMPPLSSKTVREIHMKETWQLTRTLKYPGRLASKKQQVFKK